jgi:tRNA isopentenyl-2-thiomethyl-A-37 hydroxylase MiaE
MLIHTILLLFLKTCMKHFEWNERKNELLKKSRNISFEEIVSAIQNGGLLDRLKHHNPEKYPNQFIFYIKYNNYVYTVPFVEDNNKIFLKTIFPDREKTKFYLGEKR